MERHVCITLLSQCWEIKTAHHTTWHTLACTHTDNENLFSARFQIQDYNLIGLERAAHDQTKAKGWYTESHLELQNLLYGTLDFKPIHGSINVVAYVT